MFFENRAYVTLKDSVFDSCSAKSTGGGALASINGSISLSSCTFQDNRAAQGGALGMKGTGTLSVANSTFDRNTAEYGGGALDIQHGRSWYKKSDSMNKDSEIAVTIDAGSTFTGNVAKFAGDVLFSRYYDADCALSASDPMTITYTGTAGVEDTSFVDIYRTRRVGDPDPNPDNPGSSGGGSGGCDAGFGVFALVFVAGAAVLRRKR